MIVTGHTAPHELQRMQQADACVVHKPIDGLQLARTPQTLTAGASTDRRIFPG